MVERRERLLRSHLRVHIQETIITMKLLSVVLFALFSFTASVQAFERATIAEAAENVTPLLNGQTIPNATVKTAEGDPVSLRALVMQKPSIVLFYRGGWCPYCNRQLAALKDIEKELVDMGYQVLAISPESPERLQEQKLETEFAVQLLSDESLAAIKGFGIGFYMPEELTQRYESKMKIALTDDKSDGRAVLPAPAVFIADQKGLITFNYVNPNYKVRLAPELLLEAAKYSK